MAEHDQVEASGDNHRDTPPELEKLLELDGYLRLHEQEISRR